MLAEGLRQYQQNNSPPHTQGSLRAYLFDNTKTLKEAFEVLKKQTRASSSRPSSTATTETIPLSRSSRPSSTAGNSRPPSTATTETRPLSRGSRPSSTTGNSRSPSTATVGPDKDTPPEFSNKTPDCIKPAAARIKGPPALNLGDSYLSKEQSTNKSKPSVAFEATDTEHFKKFSALYSAYSAHFDRKDILEAYQFLIDQDLDPETVARFCLKQQDVSSLLVGYNPDYSYDIAIQDHINMINLQSGTFVEAETSPTASPIISTTDPSILSLDAENRKSTTESNSSSPLLFSMD